MKKSGKLLMMAIGLTAVLAVSSPIGAEVMLKCSNIQEGFVIEFPPDWQLRENPGNGIPLVAFRPEKKETGIVFERVTISVVPAPGLTIADFYQERIKSLEKTLDDFNLVEEGITEIAELPAKWLVYRDTEKFITLIVQAQSIQYMVIEDGKAYLITCTATVKSYDDYKDTFRKIVDSFSILK